MINITYGNTYEVNQNLFRHMEIDLDLSCDSDGKLNRSIIYTLIYKENDDGKEKILYVGQTNVDPEIRIKTHMRNLKFTHIYIEQLNTNERNAVNIAEQDQIRRMNPLLQYILVPFEQTNGDGCVDYDFVLQWSDKRSKIKRPGRPKAKEECRSVNMKIPVRVLEKLDEKMPAYYNRTQLVIELLEKYISDFD